MFEWFTDGLGLTGSDSWFDNKGASKWMYNDKGGFDFGTSGLASMFTSPGAKNFAQTAAGISSLATPFLAYGAAKDADARAGEANAIAKSGLAAQLSQQRLDNEFRDKLYQQELANVEQARKDREEQELAMQKAAEDAFYQA